MRNTSGATLTLIAISTVALIIVIGGLLAITKLASGASEVSNATDAGVLGIAKQSTAIGVKLTTTDEISNFGDLKDSNGLITLRCYNRVMARALLIGLNARELGTPKALENAKKVLSIAQTGPGSIGRRLHALLAPQNAKDAPGKMQTAFNVVAQSNSARLIGPSAMVKQTDSTYRVAYTGRGDETNIYVADPDVRRKLALYANGQDILKRSTDGKDYLRGYTKIDLGNGLEYQLVSLQPLGQPHLISKQDFENNTQAPLDDKLPPNSFQSAGSTDTTTVKVGSIASAISGPFDYQWPPSLPTGYIEIYNPPGLLPELTSYPAAGANPLMSGAMVEGIFLGSGAGGQPVAFSTDSGKLRQWAAYNQDPVANPKPAEFDSEGTPYVYDASGQPADSATLAQIKGQASPTSGCTTLNMGGSGYNANCANLAGAFMNAYPVQQGYIPGDGRALMALEKLKENVWVAHHKASTLLLQLNTNEQDINLCQVVTVPGPGQPTGLRRFDRSAPQIAWNEASMAFSSAGTVIELLQDLNQTGGLFPVLANRARQIKPEATDGEIAQALNSKRLELGEVVYLYMTDEKTRRLVVSNKPPGNFVSTQPDGPRIQFPGGTYGVLGLSINPDHDGGTATRLFNEPMVDAGTKQLFAQDNAYWQASSGTYGMLGLVTFENLAFGDTATWCSVN